MLTLGGFSLNICSDAVQWGNKPGISLYGETVFLTVQNNIRLAVPRKNMDITGIIYYLPAVSGTVKIL